MNWRTIVTGNFGEGCLLDPIGTTKDTLPFHPETGNYWRTLSKDRADGKTH